MSGRNHHKAGWILIAIGVGFLAMYLFDWEFDWSWILMVVGAIILGYAIFSKGHSGVFGGTFLLLLGLLFLLKHSGVLQESMEVLWPLILIILGVSFVMVFLFRPQEWGMLIPGGILLLIGLLFFLRNYHYISRRALFGVLQWWPLLLIIIGIRLILGVKRS
jgi:membrane-bound ClpP family serine protease